MVYTTHNTSITPHHTHHNPPPGRGMALAKGSHASQTSLARLHRAHVALVLVFIACNGSERRGGNDVTVLGKLAQRSSLFNLGLEIDINFNLGSCYPDKLVTLRSRYPAEKGQNHNLKWNSALRCCMVLKTRQIKRAPWPPKTEKWGGFIYKCQEHISRDHLKKKLGLQTPRLNLNRSCKIGF